MPLLTQFGSPWGTLPVTNGRYFFVAPSGQYAIEGQTYSSSDNNDGLRPDRAVRTITYALSLVTANVGDVIVLLPGSHSVASTVIINKAGVTITGVPGNTPFRQNRRNAGGKRMRTQITSTLVPTNTTNGAIFQVAAVDVEVCFIHLIPIAAGGVGIDISPTAGAADRLYVHDCTFALSGTAATTTYGISIIAGVTANLVNEILVSNCYFVSGTDTTSGANGPAVNVLASTHGLTIEQSTFELKGTAAWANAITVSASAASCLGILIRDNDFVNPTSTTTVITTAIRATTLTNPAALYALRNYVDAGTDFATAAAINVIAVSENYLASIATDGGLLTNNL